jgi:photosynthetic reaction center H subunit
MTTATPLWANIDLAELLLILFVLFFLGLVLHLRREDRREGFPLEEDTTGRLENIEGFLWFSRPKQFILPHGAGVVEKPHPSDRDSRPLNARRLAVWPGAPLIPSGDPMVDGVGAGAYAERAKVPDLDLHGQPRIAPLSTTPTFSVVKQDADPRGFAMIGADGRVAGTVIDLWIDKMESLIRYVEVETIGADSGGKRAVLVPFAMCTVSRDRREVRTDSASASQFASAPAIEGHDQVTRYEEDRIIGYFGGGYLYANARRAESLI